MRRGGQSQFGDRAGGRPDAGATCSSPQTCNRAGNQDRTGDRYFRSLWKRFPRGQQIGRGSFGSVFLSHETLPESEWFGRPVAVKVVPLRAISDSEVALAMNEVAILKHVRHPNVLQYVDSFVDDEQQLCLVTEYVAGGDLSLLLHCFSGVDEGAGECVSSNENPERTGDSAVSSSMRFGRGANGRAAKPEGFGPGVEERQQWIESFRIVDLVRQCLDGLAHLHSRGVIHRDVKPANIYLTDSDVVKIGDFGVSKLVDPGEPTLVTFIGTPFYLCPELCLGEPYSFGADMWALGVLTYELYCMKLPFVADNVLAQIHVVTEGQYDREALHRQHTFGAERLRSLECRYGDAFVHQEKTLHQLVVVLVERLLVVDPLERPSAAQLLREFFVSNPSLCPSRATTPTPSRLCAARYGGLRSANGSASVDERQNRSSSRLGSGDVSDDPSTFVTSTSTLSPPLSVRVSGSCGEFINSLQPVKRRWDVLNISERSYHSSRSPSQPATSRCDAGGIRSPGSAAVFNPVTQQMIEAKISKIPWLVNAEAFSRLSLCEGHGDEVVRVDWKGEADFTVVSSPPRNEGSPLGFRRCGVTDDKPATGRSLLFAELSEGCNAGTGSASGVTAAGAIGVSRRLATSISMSAGMTSLRLCSNTSETPLLGRRPQSERSARNDHETYAAGHMSLGRCRGYSTKALEAILRRKILLSYVSRQRQFRALREAQQAREEENRRLRAELNELYAKCYTDKCLSILSHGCGNHTVPLSSLMGELQTPLTPAQMMEATRIGPGSTCVPGASHGVVKTLDTLTRCSYRKSCRGAAAAVRPAKLTAEVARMAADAAAVAIRCAEFAARPPLRLDLLTFSKEDMDNDYSSSVGDTQRGLNTAVYITPISLVIVRSDIDVSCRRTSAPPDSHDGLLKLPMTVALKPIRRRTRLNGIVWRVKEALKANGLDHALLFPLNIDDASQVGAEELFLRYLDSDGDVVVVSEASDWLYAIRDWRKNMNQPWVQLWMVVP